MIYPLDQKALFISILTNARMDLASISRHFTPTSNTSDSSAQSISFMLSDRLSASLSFSSHLLSFESFSSIVFEMSQDLIRNVYSFESTADYLRYLDQIKTQIDAQITFYKQLSGEQCSIDEAKLVYGEPDECETTNKVA